MNDQPYGASEPTLLFEFFAAEIFERMSVDTRDVLLQLAVVPYVTEDLALSVTTSVSAPTLLEDLYRQNYFMVRQDSPSAYQFHPLFRTFLIKRAVMRFGSDTIRTLRKRAANSLKATGS